jgi:hypothetical protein
MFLGKIKYFTSGLIIGALLFSGIGVYAATSKTVLSTIFAPVKMRMCCSEVFCN